VSRNGVPAELTAALASGYYTPYMRAKFYKLFGDASPTWTMTQITKYYLKGTTLDLEGIYLVGTDEYGLLGFVVVERGVTINAVNYTISTSKFAITDAFSDGNYLYVTAELFPEQRYVAYPGTSTYREVLSALVDRFGFTASFKDDSEAYWNNQFYPLSDVFVLNKVVGLGSLLKQKYFMNYADQGGGNIIFYAAKDTVNAENANVETTIEVDCILNRSEIPSTSSFVGLKSYDEYALIHQSTNLDSLHDLGFLRNGDMVPTDTLNSAALIKMMPVTIKPIVIPMNLDYLTGDRVKITTNFGVEKSGIGYILGGYTGANTAVIENLVFATETSAAIAATLDTAKHLGAGVNSATKGYILGGNTGALTAVIEDLIFATETSQTIAATLNTAKHAGAGVNSAVKGYILGGYTGAVTAVIEDLIFATETSAAIAATLNTAKRLGAGVNSATKGYILGGNTGTLTAVIEDLIFATETSQVIAATLNTAKGYGAGVNSTTKGYILGGYIGALTAVIEDLVFATETSQVIAATLDTAKYIGTGVNSATKGYILGGWNGAFTTVIEDLIFATETSQVIAATLNTAKGYGAGVQNGWA